MNTPARSKDNDHVLLSDDADDDRFVHEVIDLDQRAMQFLDESRWIQVETIERLKTEGA